MPTPAGYSGTPLIKKLGIRDGCRLHPIGAPPEYADLLGPLPTGARLERKASEATDLVHLFAIERAVLARQLPLLRRALRPDTAVWVSWPKKAAKVPTDITEDTVREVALPLGFVDIKVCAVSEIWSGLKLVVRKTLR